VLPDARYVLNVDDDLFKRVLSEIADSRSYPCGLFYCGRQLEDIDGRDDLGIHADERGQERIDVALSSGLATIGHCFQTQVDNSMSKKLVSSLVLESPAKTRKLLLQMGVSVKNTGKGDEVEVVSEDEEKPAGKQKQQNKKNKARGRGRGKKGDGEGQADKNRGSGKKKPSEEGTNGNTQGQSQKKSEDGNKSQKQRRPHYRRGNRNKGGKAGGGHKQGAGENRP
jgi:hypothetical protein